MDKKTQRREIKKVLNAMSKGERERLSHAASLNLLSLEEIKSAKTIMTYCSMPYECDPSFAADRLMGMGKTLVYPYCVDDKNMIAITPLLKAGTDAFHDYFIEGMYGILTPDINRSKTVAKDEIDVVIVPAMAFDREFHRLGHGAGYYDRFLRDARAFKVGFAFDEQLMEALAFDEYDVAPDCIVTPTQILRRN